MTTDDIDLSLRAEKHSFDHFNKCLELARRGYSVFQNVIAEYYEEGKFVLKCGQEAFAWFKKSADQGNAYACRKCGDYRMKGCDGVTKNPEEAVRYYRLAAGAETSAANPARLRLAQCYEKGIGVERDLAIARQYYEKAAEQGNPDAKKWMVKHAAAPKSAAIPHPLPIVEIPDENDSDEDDDIEETPPKRGEKPFGRRIGECYLCCTIDSFLSLSESDWLRIMKNRHAELAAEDPSASQILAWKDSFTVMNRAFSVLCAGYEEYGKIHAVFEYVMPGRNPDTTAPGKQFGIRPDCVLVSQESVIVLEFKQFSQSNYPELPAARP